MPGWILVVIVIILGVLLAAKFANPMAKAIETEEIGSTKQGESKK